MSHGFCRLSARTESARIRIRWLLVIALHGVIASVACSASEKPPTGPPNVLMIVVDTLRADRLSSYGDERGLTPFLDGLAVRGVVFANAYAPSS